MIFGYEAWVLWLAAAVLMLLIEVTTISLIPIWFACGCILALVLDWLGYSPEIQFAAMITASLVLLFLFMFVVRPRLHESGESAIASHDFLGQEGVVVDRIDPETGVGLVSVCGSTWSAGSENGRAIEKDCPIRVVSIRGQKAMVLPITHGLDTEPSPDPAAGSGIGNTPEH